MLRSGDGEEHDEASESRPGARSQPDYRSPTFQPDCDVPEQVSEALAEAMGVDGAERLTLRQVIGALVVYPDEALRAPVGVEDRVTSVDMAFLPDLLMRQGHVVASLMKNREPSER